MKFSVCSLKLESAVIVLSGGFQFAKSDAIQPLSWHATKAAIHISPLWTKEFTRILGQRPRIVKKSIGIDSRENKSVFSAATLIVGL